MGGQEAGPSGERPSVRAQRRPQPSEHSSLESQAVTLDTMDSGPFPESSDEEESLGSADAEATSPGGSAKPSSTVVKTDPEDSGAGEQDPISTRGGSSVPVQKRRRVTRACDECRRKKIKCDGKQPCAHCSVYSYGEHSSALSFHQQRLNRRKAH